MNQIWIDEVGLPEVLTLREAPEPEPGPGEVRVRVAAAGINFADILIRMGLYPDAPGYPIVAGYEISGEVDGVGAGNVRYEREGCHHDLAGRGTQEDRGMGGGGASRDSIERLASGVQ